MPFQVIVRRESTSRPTSPSRSWSRIRRRRPCGPGALLKIPELWVLDIPRHRLTFYHLASRGKHKGTYRPSPRSRAFPVLTSAEVMELLDDPEDDDIAFLENCRGWARRVLVPRLQPDANA